MRLKLTHLFRSFDDDIGSGARIVVVFGRSRALIAIGIAVAFGTLGALTLGERASLSCRIQTRRIFQYVGVEFVVALEHAVVTASFATLSQST